jgi:hypothetical protein
MAQRLNLLQEAIRWAVRQRRIACRRNDMTSAQFWQDELDQLRARVPARPAAE